MRQGCSPDDAAPELPAQLVLGMTDDLPVRRYQWIGDPNLCTVWMKLVFCRGWNMRVAMGLSWPRHW